VGNATPQEFTVEHRYADLGEVHLHYVEAGEGLLIVLLRLYPLKKLPQPATLYPQTSRPRSSRPSSLP
jgi:hypothetical protein